MSGDGRISEERTLKFSDIPWDGEISTNESVFNPAVVSGYNALRTSAHPVTEIYCNQFGVIIFRRHNAPDIPLFPLDAARSRSEALRRAQFVSTLYSKRDLLQQRIPMSSIGVGLSPIEIVNQTIAAVEKSVQVSRKIKEEEKRLEDKYRLTPIDENQPNVQYVSNIKRGTLAAEQVKETVKDLDEQGETDLRDSYESYAKRAGLL